MQSEIRRYNDAQEPDHKALCDALAKEIDAALPDAESKVWHAHPVWFLAGNPIAGYSRQKPGIRLMFWSGADFGEPGLDVLGKKFKDASVFFQDAKQIDRKALRRWLAKSREIQWDYKNIVRNKGKLTRLDPTPAERRPSAGTSAAPKAAKFASHDEYLATMPEEIRAILRKVQATVEAALPKAKRCIGYGMPAYREDKVFFYFAGFKKHLGIFPPVTRDRRLIRELAPYRNEKGNLAFPYAQPIPHELIGRVAVALSAEYARRP